MSAAIRFRKRPVAVDAVQWLGGAASATPVIDWILASGGTARYFDALDAWTSDDGSQGHSASPEELSIDTLEGTIHASPGDWIIRGVKGEFYPCKPDVFAETYAPAVDVDKVQGDDLVTVTATAHDLHVAVTEVLARLAGEPEADHLDQAGEVVDRLLEAGGLDVRVDRVWIGPDPRRFAAWWAGICADCGTEIAVSVRECERLPEDELGTISPHGRCLSGHAVALTLVGITLEPYTVVEDDERDDEPACQHGELDPVGSVDPDQFGVYRCRGTRGGLFRIERDADKGTARLRPVHG